MFILIFFIALFVLIVIKRIKNRSKYTSFDIHNSYESMSNMTPSEIKTRITEDEILLNSTSDQEKRKFVLEYLEFKNQIAFKSQMEFKNQIESLASRLPNTPRHKRLFTFHSDWNFMLRNDLDGNLLINHLRDQSNTCTRKKDDYLYFDLSLDFHMLTLKETSEIFERVIDFCMEYDAKITVIHGYKNGTTLKTFFREYSRKNVTVSSNDFDNKGRTFFCIGCREWEEFSFKNKNSSETVVNKIFIDKLSEANKIFIDKLNEANKILTDKLNELNISDDDVYEYLSMKKVYADKVEEIYDRYLFTNENYEIIGSEFKVVDRKNDFNFLMFDDLYLSCKNIKDYLDSAEKYLIPNNTISYPILSRNGPFINYTTGYELGTIDSRTIKAKSNRVYIKKNRLYIENFR